MERQKSKCSVQIFSRVTGFYSATDRWNPGKVNEFKDRKKYDLKKND